MRKVFVAAVAILSLCGILNAAPVLEDYLSSWFPSSLCKAPGRDRIAWVFNDSGRRNVWVADGPEYRPRKITNYADDDGQELGGLVFTPDGATLVYARGGDPNSRQENPNPVSNPRGAKQEVWSVAVEGGSPVNLGTGSSPAPAADSNTVVFVRGGQFFSNTLKETKEAAPYFSARGVNGNPVWSPDGKRLAFVSSRGDHSFIGIFDPARQQLTWMAPDVDLDFAPAWSPDGKFIAYFRFPGQKAETGGSWEPASSFSIWVADVETGAGKPVWKSPNSTGGFAQGYPGSPLLWSADNRLVFFSEQDGWMRLYSVSSEGGRENPLSPPACEAEGVTLSTSRKDILFNSNCDDIERRHLWTVPAAGGQAKQLTRGDGIEWSPIAVDGTNNLVYFGSSATQPATPMVVPTSGGQGRLLIAEALGSVPVKDLVIPQPLVYRSMDGMEIHAQLFLPPGHTAQAKHPALVFMHGGPIRQMLPGWHYMDYYHNAYGMNQFLAANGYVVLSVNYRCGIGYGRDFRRAANQGPYGASEYQDIVAGARLLQKRSDVDPERVGLWGGSYGGYLTAMGLARDSQLFAAGVDFHGVHDWALRARIRGAEDWGIRGDDAMRKATDSSPVADVASWTSPVLFIMGDDDRNVDFIETVDLVQRLREAGKAHVETLIFPDEVHDILCHRNWVRAYKATLEFFSRNLSKQN